MLFALGLVPVYLFTRKRLGSLPGYCFAGAYALFWGIQVAVAFDFHEVAFAVPLTAFAIYFMDGKKWVGYFFCISLLLLVKEDMAILVAFFGLCLIVQRQIKQGAVTFLAGALWFFLVIRVFIPSCHPPGDKFGYWGWYDQFGTDFSSILKNMLRNPLRVVRSVFEPWQKTLALLATFSPFGFLALISPLAILTIPIFLVRFLSNNSLWWGTGFHYSATLSPIVVMASADGLFRLSKLVGQARWRPRLIAAASILVLVINVALIPVCPLWKLTKPSFYCQSGNDVSGYKALEYIPRTASVVAQDEIIPHLSHRQEVYVLKSDAPDADYIIAASALSPWPSNSYADIERYLAERLESGYVTIFSENGWIVLERQPTT